MSTKDLKNVKILGVSVNSTSYEQLLRIIRLRLENFAEKGKFLIVTPNPEIVMKAQDDELLNEILNKADISVPDGIGLIAGIKYNSLVRPKKVVRRFITLIKQGFSVGLAVLFDQKWIQSEAKLIKGRVLFMKLIILANKKGWNVVLIGDKKQSAQKAAEKLRQNYKKVKIYAFTGPDLDSNANIKLKEHFKTEENVIGRINKIHPEIVFVGFGAPKQEKWIYRVYDKLNFGCIMTVGGTFDYISGIRKKSPSWIEAVNLEWLWRLFSGDQKLTRVASAFPGFAFRVFLAKMVEK